MYNFNVCCLLQAQEAHGGSQTQLEVLRDLTSLLSEPSMQWGRLVVVSGGDHVVSFLRSAAGFDTFLVAVNVGDADEVVNLRRGSDDVPAEGMIRASTKNFLGEGRADAFEVGTSVALGSVKLHAGEGVVVAWPPQ